MIDALIIGKGPAAMAAAITLGQQGRSVAIVSRTEEQHFRAGESLTSSALISLNELGLKESFLNAGHLACHGNCSCWGNDNLQYYDFIQSPLGQGWYIDRPLFNSMLAGKASTYNIPIVTAHRGDTIAKSPGHWTFHSGDKMATTIEAKFIIDASGRNNWLGRQLGISRLGNDKQIAVFTLLKAHEPSPNYHSLIEAVEDGWWYVAEAGHGLTACMFFTDPDLHEKSNLLDPEFLQQKRTQTKFIKYRIADSNYIITTPPQLLAAGTSYLPVCSGDGWAASGDAACSFDPLSSFGIAFALRSGIDAATAVHKTLDGQQNALADYNQTIQLAIDHYLQQRKLIYQEETRFASNPFWTRRTIE